MIILEVVPNPNCDAVDLRVFHDLAPAQQIRHIQLELEPGRSTWCDVTGWTANGTPCPALAQKVDDSGEGTAYLVYGGDGGLRFRRTGSTDAWDISNADQWGEPLRITTELSDFR